MSTVLLKPLISEKAVACQGKGVYGFVVSKTACKVVIKKEVESLYKVRVLDVRTLIQPRKRKSRNTKRRIIVGYRSGYKKAYVHLAEGDSIDFYAAS